jgi:hypothetical protein
VHDRVKAGQRVSGRVPHISPGRREVDATGYEVAASQKESVDPGDREAGVMQERRHHGTDVSVMAGDEDLHSEG